MGGVGSASRTATGQKVLWGCIRHLAHPLSCWVSRVEVGLRKQGPPPRLVPEGPHASCHLPVP